MSELSEEQIILLELYNNEINSWCWYPQPATSISYTTKISIYKTRKILHKLQNEGIVKFERGYVPDRFSYEGELEEEAFFYCGWELTDKGKNNDTYKKMYKEYCEWQDKVYRDLAKLSEEGDDK